MKVIDPSELPKHFDAAAAEARWDAEWERRGLYAHDPDGIEFEVAWVVPKDLLTDEALAGRKQIRPLDIAREKQRYGATTRGGIGISAVAP